MKKEPVERSSIERMNLVHIAIGGGICLGMTVLLISIIIGSESTPGLLQQLLFKLGMSGVTFFIDYYQIAQELFIFGLVYLTSGFCGGIYAGYNAFTNLKGTLFIPAIISTVGFVLLAIFVANYSITPEFLGLILLQLAGNTLGSYLGGYAINWRYLHEEEKTPEKLTLEIRK